MQSNLPKMAAKLAFETAKSDNVLGFAVLISANAEWRAVKPLFSAPIHTSPYGEYFVAKVAEEDVLFSPWRMGESRGRRVLRNTSSTISILRT